MTEIGKRKQEKGLPSHVSKFVNAASANAHVVANASAIVFVPSLLSGATGMIIYNVGRAWFTEKALAEKARIAQGLKPSATIKLMVNSREALAMLLNALCDAKPSTPLIDRIVEAAYVEPTLDIDAVVPKFLLREHHEREERMAKLRVNRGGDR